MPQKKKKFKKLTKALQNLEITETSQSEAAPISTEDIQVAGSSKSNEQSLNEETPKVNLVFNEAIDLKLSTKWPKHKERIPPVFLHRPADLEKHARRMVSAGVKFYQPHKGRHHTRIQCPTLEDYKGVTSYFDKFNLPYHTFSLPSKKKIRFVIRGVPDQIDLIELKKAFISASVPIVRIHKMRRAYDVPGQPILLLVVVPYDDEGKNILKLKEISGSAVKIEKPLDKPKQCFRCQRWGHSQRFCHGELHCVKCGDNHSTKKCLRDKDKEPPKCVNCRQKHTASYKLCSFCPTSQAYQLTSKIKASEKVSKPKPKLVTIEACGDSTIKSNLYHNAKITKKAIKNILKPKTIIPM